MRSRLTRLSVAIAGCLVVAGCDSASPTPAPLPKQTPSRTASATADAAPTMPAAAKGTDAAAAKAFVRYYVAQVNFAGATGQVEHLNELAGPECASCANVAKKIASLYRAGGRIESDGWTVTAVQVVKGTSSDSPSVDAAILLSPQTVYSKASAKPERLPGGRLPITFHLSHRSGSWLVSQWERAA